MRKIIGIALLLTVVLVYAFAPSDGAKRTIVIDAGHGGKDPGAQVDELLEKEIVQNIAIKMRDLNTSMAYEVILLRENDAFMSLADRVAKINALQPDLVLSLHVNYSDNPEQNGVELYVSQENEFYEAARKEADAMSEVFGKGLLEVQDIREGNYFILKNCKAPAVQIDLGFLSNTSDRAYITSAVGQEELAALMLAHFNQ